MAVFFILALISAYYPAEDQLVSKSFPGQPAIVIHPLSHIDLGLCLIRMSAPLEIPLSFPKEASTSTETRAPPA